LAGVRVATVDSLISLFAGILIFPLALAGTQAISGPELLFKAVPVLMNRIAGGAWFGIGLFLCLYLASLGASMGLLETISANFRDAYRWKRSRATIVASLLCLAAALLPALSSNLLSEIRLASRGVLELLDGFIITWLLPLAALMISQVVLYFLSDKVKRGQFETPESEAPLQMYSHWKLVLRWIVTPLILVALALQLFEFVRSI
jgi:NSS family neurotransmitter:Na+ symporter